MEVERGKDGSFDRDGIAKALRLDMVAEEGKTFKVCAVVYIGIYDDRL